MAKDTSSRPDPTDKNDYEEETKTDVTIYPDTEEATRAYTIKPSRQTKEDEKGGNKRIRDSEAKTAWSWAYLCIEAKADTAFSPFELPKEAKPSDPSQAAQTPPQKPKVKGRAKRAKKVASATRTDPAQTASSRGGRAKATRPAKSQTRSVPTANGADSPTTTAAQSPATSSPDPVSKSTPSFMRLDTDGGAQSMGQISRYAAKIMRRQFLAYCFTIFVCRKYAWFMRWDRAGLVVSEPFDFIQQPQLLHQFFYRFACMTDVQRGCDPTVQPATTEEIRRMRTLADFDTDWHKAKFLDSIEEGPVVKISVPAIDMITRDELERGRKDEQTGSSSTPVLPREFLVGKPHFMSNSPTGSGTKGFIAYDITEHRLVFLKDCWRPDAETYHPEGEIYLHLHSHKVNYIATPIAAGDVADNDGGIHTTRADKFLGTPRWKHYRIILEEFAMPLEEYIDSYDLVDVLYCAVRGLSTAPPLAMFTHSSYSASAGVGGGCVAQRCQCL